VAAFTLIFHFNRVPGPSPIKLFGGLCYWTSRLAMMIFYVLTIVRLAQIPVWQRRLAPLERADLLELERRQRLGGAGNLSVLFSS